MSDMKFKISSGLKSIIGRDLITNDFVAIFELVKNSFDAHATKVKVVFELEKKETAAIYIIDNGKGMSAEDINEKWLFVAYSAKKDGSEDRGLRHVYAGSKGVGRFSCDRLGRLLTLQSKDRRQPFVNFIDVDWGDFEKEPKQEFHDITIDYSAKRKFETPPVFWPSSAAHGTVLKITELREYESWTREKLLRLKRSLQKLLDPFSGSLQKRELELICRRESRMDDKADSSELMVNGVIRNNVFNKFFRQSTVIKVTLKDSLVETALIDRGEEIYRISEDAELSYPELCRCGISCDIAYLNRGSKISFARTMGIPPIEYGSVFLVHNGFRVYPVGDEFDDFWGLNRRKQQGYNRYLGTREVFGCVRIDDDGNLFQEASNREGLVMTPAVEALQGFMLASIRRLEAYVTRVTWRDPSDSDNLTPEDLSKSETRARIIRLVRDMVASPKVKIISYNKDLISLLNVRAIEYGSSLGDLRALAEKTGDKTLLGKVDAADARYKALQSKLDEQTRLAQGEQIARQKAEADAANAKNEARRNKTAYDEERKRNLFLVTNAPRDKRYLESFMHQILKYASQSKQKIHNFVRYDKKSPEKVELLCTKLLYLLEKIYSASHFAISADFRLSAEFVTENVPLFVSQYAKMVCMGYDGLVIETKLPQEPFVLKFNPMELGLIIENLVSNSCNAHASKMTISMQIKNHGSGLDIIFSDNGNGVDADIPVERIFEKGFSRTSGSGLGLYTCKWVAEERMKAVFWLSDKGRNGRGAEFTLRLSK